METFTRKFINSLLPPGSLWVPERDGDFDKYLDGQALNMEEIVAFYENLAHLRDPQKTILLDELEIEYGISKNEDLTEQQRRDFLESWKANADGNGSADDLQQRLQDAGFTNCQVHENSPAVDLTPLLDNFFAITCASGGAYAGHQQAFCRRIGGEIIVNGDQFKERPNFTVTAGQLTTVAGNQGAIAGVFDGYIREKIEYDLPTSEAAWPFLFVIGGDAVRDVGGELLSVERLTFPIETRANFIKTVVQYKPLHSWGVSVVDFT